jgi:hypothetical protein
MKNLLLSILILTVCVTTSSAQQLEDGVHKFLATEHEFTVILTVEEDGDKISKLDFIHQKDTLSGYADWIRAPKNSDMAGRGWYDAVLDGRIYLELDVLKQGELKITENVDGVMMVMIVSVE